MDKYGGHGIGIRLIISDRSITGESFSAFRLHTVLDAMPEGEFAATISNDPDFSPKSGEYGFLIFTDAYGEGLADRLVKIFVTVVDLVKIDGTSSRISGKFVVGTPDTMCTRTYTYKGTSISAMADAFGRDGASVVNLMESAGMDATDDTMTWRYVNGTLAERLGTTAGHSVRQNDYVFYAFSNDTGTFVISSFQYALSQDPYQLVTFSPNAPSGSTGSKYIDPKTKSVLWNYCGEQRCNTLGDHLEDLYPNFVFTGIVNGDIAVGNCTGGCFSNVMKSLGDTTDPSLRRQMGVDPLATYGPPKRIEAYPGNTGKLYPLAGAIRAKILATYGKSMTVSFENTFGPDLGTAPCVLAMSTDFRTAGPFPDPVYSDRYIVMCKDYIMTNEDNRGYLGMQHHVESGTFVTNVRLVSANTVTGDLDAVTAMMQKFDKSALEKAQS